MNTKVKLDYNKLQISKEKTWYTIYGLTLSQKNQLEEWTRLKFGEILFDSNIDNWSWENGPSVLNERILDKYKLAFIIEDSDGEIFGYYHDSVVYERFDHWKEYMRSYTNSYSFHFNLQSNGRLPKPMKFEIKDVERGGICLSDGEFLIHIGDISLYKEDSKEFSLCNQNEYRFDYHGIKNALCGKSGEFVQEDDSIHYEWEGNEFTPIRIFVIQMV